VLLIAALTLVAVTVASFVRAERSEFERASAHSQTLMELRRDALEDYLETIRSEVTLWSGRPALREALRELKRGWDALPGDRSQLLQRLYVDENPHPTGQKQELLQAGDGSLYSGIHGLVHPRGRRFLANLGYYDAFLFDIEGNLIYTAFKERDFATNLDVGPWADTGLGRAFRAARDAKEADFIVFTDFAPYEPSNGEPAGFVASPVRDEDGSSLGVLALQVPLNRINMIMQFTGGMGDTGETYIVGEDRLMRSDSRFSDTTTILKTRVETEATRRALAGETGVDIVVDYRGVPVLSAYGPLEFEGVRWAVIAEIDEAEIKQRALEPRRLLASVLFGTAAIAAVAGLVLTYMMGRAERPESWTEGL
jgi:methyl-accepting chemotaxis protein